MYLIKLKLRRNNCYARSYSKCWSEVGKNCIINSKSLIEHDAVIGNNSHVSTRATLNGEVKLGYNSFVRTHSY